MRRNRPSARPVGPSAGRNPSTEPSLPRSSDTRPRWGSPKWGESLVSRIANAAKVLDQGALQPFTRSPISRAFDRSEIFGRSEASPARRPRFRPSDRPQTGPKACSTASNLLILLLFYFGWPETYPHPRHLQPRKPDYASGRAFGGPRFFRRPPPPALNAVPMAGGPSGAGDRAPVCLRSRPA